MIYVDSLLLMEAQIWKFRCEMRSTNRLKISNLIMAIIATPLLSNWQEMKIARTLMVREAIQNIVKHAAAASIRSHVTGEIVYHVIKHKNRIWRRQNKAHQTRNWLKKLIFLPSQRLLFPSSFSSRQGSSSNLITRKEDKNTQLNITNLSLR